MWGYPLEHKKLTNDCMIKKKGEGEEEGEQEEEKQWLSIPQQLPTADRTFVMDDTWRTSPQSMIELVL